LDSGCDGSSLWRELYRVGEQVREDLHEAVGVADDGEHGWSVHLDADLVLTGKRCDAAHRVLQRLHQVTGLPNNLDVTRLHLLDVENVVDETDQTLSILESDPEELLALGAQLARRPSDHEPKRAADRRQRRAQLVADGRHEVGLELFQL